MPLRPARRPILPLLIASLLAAVGGGCSTMKDVGTGVATVALIDSASLISIETLAGGWIMYVLYDPSAPNWEVQAVQESEDTWAISLQHKALHTGGDGEARQVFQRAAKRVAREQGLNTFDIMAYQEGVESTRPFARRVAHGEVRLVGSRIFPNAKPLPPPQPAPAAPAAQNGGARTVPFDL